MNRTSAPRSKLSILECFVLVALVAALLQFWRSHRQDWNDLERAAYFAIAGAWCGGYLLGRGLIRRGLVPTVASGTPTAIGLTLYYQLPWQAGAVLAAAAIVGGCLFSLLPWGTAQLATFVVTGQWWRGGVHWRNVCLIAAALAAAIACVCWLKPWSDEPLVRHWTTRQLAVPAPLEGATSPPLGVFAPLASRGLRSPPPPPPLRGELSPDGRQLISVMPDPRRRSTAGSKVDLVTLHTRSGQITSRALVQESDDKRRLYDIAISPTGESVGLLYPWLNKIHVIDVRSGATRWTASPMLHANPTAIAFLDERRLVAVGLRYRPERGFSLTREIWSIGKPAPDSARTDAWAGPVRCQALTATGSHALVCDARGERRAAALWSCDGPVELARLEPLPASARRGDGRLHLCGRWCASGNSLWDLKTGQRIELSGAALGFLPRYDRLIVGETRRLAPTSTLPPPWVPETPFVRILFELYDRAVNLAIVDLADPLRIQRTSRVTIDDILGGDGQLLLDWRASEDGSTVVAIDGHNNMVVWRIGWGW